MTAAAAVLTVASSLIVVTIAQIVLALLMVACGIHVTRLLHDEIPSAVRAGVASGVIVGCGTQGYAFALHRMAKLIVEPKR